MSCLVHGSVLEMDLLQSGGRGVVVVGVYQWWCEGAQEMQSVQVKP